MPSNSDVPDESLGTDADRLASRDYKNIVGGVACLIIAALFIVPSFEYGLGTPQRMGPGFFPFVLGVMLALIGLAILLPALNTPGIGRPIYWRPATSIFLGIAAFALILDRFGLVPAVWAVVVMTALGDKDFKLWRVVILALAVSAAASAIFVYGLSLPLPLFRMP